MEKEIKSPEVIDDTRVGIELNGQVPDSQIALWKHKHGAVYSVKVEGHIAYLKKPDRTILSAASAIGQSDPIKFSEILLENCWLGGSEEIKTNDTFFLGVSGKLGELLEVAEAQLVKL